MNIVIEETMFSKNVSTIEVTVYKRGSVAGASMFEMCGFTIFAKKRGYSHYVILEHSSNPDCSDCEWTSKTTIGYLNDVNPEYVQNIGNFDEPKKDKMGEIEKLLSEQFPLNYKSKELSGIIAIKDVMLICKRLETICSW
jgi:hypothetical protein